MGKIRRILALIQEGLSLTGKIFFIISNTIMESEQNKCTLTTAEVKEISMRHMHASDKFHRMYGGIASSLERYEDDIMYLKIENTETKYQSDLVTAFKFAGEWALHNDELFGAKGFVVAFYRTEMTGFIMSLADIKNSDYINKAERLTFAKQGELIGIYSGLLYSGCTFDK